MNDMHTPLTALSETKRIKALSKFQSIRPFLEDGVSLPTLSKQVNVPLRTLRRRVKQYREGGLTALVSHAMTTPCAESDPIMHQLIEGLVLKSPKITIANIKRTVNLIAEGQGWPKLSYSSVFRVVKRLDNGLLLLAHQGSKAYCDKFDLIYRRESTGPNDIWQADHCLLDCWLKGTKDKLERPWLTVILDDHSRAVCGYLLSFDAPCSINTALAQHQAIWRKTDSQWHIQGIPSCFYTDHGSDFTSKRMEQVAADLKMQLIFSLPGRPRGRGKIERFFRTVNETFLAAIPGFNNRSVATPISLPRLTEMFHAWLLEQYLVQTHSELGCSPQEKWEQGGFLPRQAESLEQLDLLLFTVPKVRKVHQDGIHYQGLRYIEPTLAAFVGESVTIRYDPRDLAEIRVFYEDKFLCRAICTKLESTAISLKEIVRARNQRRRELKTKINSRYDVVADYISAHAAEEHIDIVPAVDKEPAQPKLKRYLNED